MNRKFELAHEIECSGSPNKLDGCTALKEDVVNRFRSKGCGRPVGDRPHHVRNAQESSQVVWTGSEGPHEQHIVFTASIVTNGAEHIRKEIEFEFGMGWVNFDIDERERESFIRLRSADTECCDERLVQKDLAWISHLIDGAAVDFQNAAIKEEGGVFFDRLTPDPDWNREVVVSTCLVDLFEQVKDDRLVMPPDSLDRHYVESTDNLSNLGGRLTAAELLPIEWSEVRPGNPNRLPIAKRRRGSRGTASRSGITTEWLQLEILESFEAVVGEEEVAPCHEGDKQDKREDSRHDSTR